MLGYLLKKIFRSSSVFNIVFMGFGGSDGIPAGRMQKTPGPHSAVPGVLGTGCSPSISASAAQLVLAVRRPGFDPEGEHWKCGMGSPPAGA